MSRPVRVPLFLQVPKAELHRQSISYDSAAAVAGVSWTSQAQMLDEVHIQSIDDIMSSML